MKVTERIINGSNKPLKTPIRIPSANRSQYGRANEKIEARNDSIVAEV